MTDKLQLPEAMKLEERNISSVQIVHIPIKTEEVCVCV